jgi:hypothetical protein
MSLLYPDNLNGYGLSVRFGKRDELADPSSKETVALLNTKIKHIELLSKMNSIVTHAIIRYVDLTDTLIALTRSHPMFCRIEITNPSGAPIFDEYFLLNSPKLIRSTAVNTKVEFSMVNILAMLGDTYIDYSNFATKWDKIDYAADLASILSPVTDQLGNPLYIPVNVFGNTSISELKRRIFAQNSKVGDVFNSAIQDLYSPAFDESLISRSSFTEAAAQKIPTALAGYVYDFTKKRIQLTRFDLDTKSAVDLTKTDYRSEILYCIVAQDESRGSSFSFSPNIDLRKRFSSFGITGVIRWYSDMAKRHSLYVNPTEYWDYATKTLLNDENSCRGKRLDPEQFTNQDIVDRLIEKPYYDTEEYTTAYFKDVKIKYPGDNTYQNLVDDILDNASVTVTVPWQMLHVPGQIIQLYIHDFLPSADKVKDSQYSGWITTFSGLWKIVGSKTVITPTIGVENLGEYSSGISYSESLQLVRFKKFVEPNENG